MERNIDMYACFKLVSWSEKITEKWEYINEWFGKAHCLMIVHRGINKNLSNEAVFDTYDEFAMF